MARTTLPRFPQQYSLKILSSLSLQLVLYFNVRYFVLFEAVLVLYMFNAAELSPVTLLPFVLFLVMEPIRLFLGYSANLQDKLFHLLGFLALTIFPVMEAGLALVFMPQETYVMYTGIPYVFFFLFELILGFGQFSKLLKESQEQFFVRRMQRRWIGKRSATKEE